MPYYLIVAGDGTDPDAPARRAAARGDHFAALPSMLTRGELLLGGAMLDEAGAMTGSALVVEFADRAALDEWLAREPYMQAGVWRHVTVTPFRLAVMADRSLAPSP